MQYYLIFMLFWTAWVQLLHSQKANEQYVTVDNSPDSPAVLPTVTRGMMIDAGLFYS